MKLLDLPPMERLAVEQALLSRIGEDVSTKNPDSLRHMMDEDMVATYLGTGYKSRDVMVNGQKVGTHSIRMGGGKKAKKTKRLVVRDQHALENFIVKNEESYAEAYANALSRNFAEFVLRTFGELPDGCEVIEETIPEVQPSVQGTTLRIDSEKVAKAIKGYLPTGVAYMLGGDEDGAA